MVMPLIFRYILLNFPYYSLMFLHRIFQQYIDITPVAWQKPMKTGQQMFQLENSQKFFYFYRLHIPIRTPYTWCAFHNVNILVVMHGHVSQLIICNTCVQVSNWPSRNFPASIFPLSSPVLENFRTSGQVCQSFFLWFASMFIFGFLIFFSISLWFYFFIFVRSIFHIHELF